MARVLFRASDARLRQTRNLGTAEIRTILICRPNHRLGNLLLLTPLVSELQRAFPDAKVDMLLAGDDGAELFRGFPNVRHVYGLSRRMIRHPLALVRTMLQIRRACYDLAVDPCEASQSSRLLMVMANAKHTIGLPRTGSAMSAEEQETILRAPRHMAQWPVYLLRRAMAQHAPDLDRDLPDMDIRLAADERQQARSTLEALLRAHGEADAAHVVGVFAEATGAKRYPRAWWQRFIAELRIRHADAALFEILPPDGQPRLALDLPTFHSRSPRQVAAMIANMTCFISADCGVMHLASASGTPTIGLFSVTDASKYGPYGHGSRALVTHGKDPQTVARLAGEHLASLIAAYSGNSGPALAQGPRKEHMADSAACPAMAGVDAPKAWTQPT